jgi:hypothetical protein
MHACIFENSFFLYVFKLSQILILKDIGNKKLVCLIQKNS